MSTTKPTIIYTKTDEAPMLATVSFLPILRAFAGPAGVDIELRDISLAARVLAQFSDRLPEAQRVSDDLAYLGEVAKTPEANIIKLPNISASVPQMKACIKELQAHGYALPDFPEEPATDEEKEVAARYAVAMGSAVNPVLREGNSDRRAPKAVKEYARQNPHRMGAWSPDSKSHVATMSDGDFRHTEKSCTIEEATSVNIEFVSDSGESKTLKKGLKLEAGEIIDASRMSREKLVEFLQRQVQDAREQGVLFSLHMKATMMKVSDPIIFGHAVRVYFHELFDKYGETFDRIGFDPNNGFGDLTARLDELSTDERAAIEADIERIFDEQPDLAMVNSHKGITNLHVPSDVIVDASMPAMIRNSGQMWNKNDETQDTKAVIPDSSYAPIYEVVIEDCKAHGAYDPTTMGSVPNVGLMAKKAEEYGSHDKTFEIPAAGVVRVVAADGTVLTEHSVDGGDIWRMCQVKDAPVRDWVELAVRRARASGVPAVFWLDKSRAHDRELIKKVERYLADLDTSGLEILIKSPVDAMQFSLERIRQGKDTISVTGNVLRDYLTDLFPILEVGTSAKMLSIVPLMQGGGLFETGAGGSAPKHIQQLLEEGHLRWDSLGEFLALGVSFEHIAEKEGYTRAQLLADALDRATTRYLLDNKSPGRKVGELDNRGSHVYLALFWARALSEQTEDPALAERFAGVAAQLDDKLGEILAEIDATQGSPHDIGGYYDPDDEKLERVMRPSQTLNDLIANV